jgi:hypothetical protein
MQTTVPEGRRSAVTRLAAMLGQKRLASALAVAAAAVALSACGSSSGDQTIDPADAQILQTDLNAVQLAVAEGHCNVARARADEFVAAVNGLPDTVGTTNKNALRSAGAHLETLAEDRSQCEPTNTTGASGTGGVQPTTSSTTTTPAPTTPESTTSSTTTSSTTSEPPPGNSGGNQGGGQTGGGPSGTGGGNTGGGGGGSGGGTGTGGTGTGGTGGGGGTG